MPHRTSRHTRRSIAPLTRRIAATTFILAFLTSALAPGATATPEDDRINDLRAQSRTTAAEINTLDKRIADLQAQVDDAWTVVEAAAEDYAQATEDLKAAEKTTADATERYDSALASKEESRKVLVQIVRERSRVGGSTSTIQAFFAADKFDEAIAEASAEELVQDRAQRAVQQLQADTVVADTLAQAAQKAQADLAEVREESKSALNKAKRQQEKAEQLQISAKSERESAVVRLADLRNSTVAAEQARQDKLEEKRQKAREDAARQAAADRAARDQEQQEETSKKTKKKDGNKSSGSNNSSKNNSGNTGNGGDNSDSGSTTGGESGTNTGSGSGSGSGTGSGSGSGSDSGTGGSTGGGTGTGEGSGSGTGGGSDAGGGSGSLLGQGTAVGTAAQGQAAVAAAKARLGTPYGWGATGPNAYDCSGLTMTAWSKAGVNITRTSRSQYLHVKKIQLSSMRPGDLLFWGSDLDDPMSITHVAMFIGNGQMIEAPRPGLTVRITSIRYDERLMPYAGRP